MFTTTLQDHGIADIVGEPTEGPANQTVQVQTLDLTNTGFQAVAPIYFFTRAGGDASVGGVAPDIPIRCDSLGPMACVSDLVGMHR